MDGIRFDLEGRFGDFTLAARAAIPARGVTALVGPSGSGKTMLLRCLAGLSRAKGEVCVGEAVWQDAQGALPVHRRGVGYVFQEPSLFAHLSVRGNLVFAARRAGQGMGPGFEAVVDIMGLGALLDRAPASLSGGERQRTAIARALLSRPSLLLMDEPLSSLDAEAKAEVMPFLDELHWELALPVIYVTHDAAEVSRLADRVLTMRHGRLEGPADLSGGDSLGGLSDAQIRALARAALAQGLQAESGP
jgi:molybdate transport system ATP-binding protein